MKTMIETNHLERNFKDFQLDVTFTLPEGKITGLVGVNGAGKSTLYNLVLGLDRKDGGIAKIFGKDAWTLDEKDKARIGVVLSDSGFPNFFKLKDVEKVMEAFFPEFDTIRFNKLCQKMKLPADKELQKYSTGMQAKLKVIAALCHEPDLLLLDEPTAGLDVIARNEVLDLIREYMEKPGRSVLISSHIASDLETLCDDFVLLYAGKVILKEQMPVLQDEYGIVSTKEKLDLEGTLARKKTNGGWKYLVRDRQYVKENFPALDTAAGNVDEMMEIAIRGEWS